MSSCWPFTSVMHKMLDDISAYDHHQVAQNLPLATIHFDHPYYMNFVCNLLEMTRFLSSHLHRNRRKRNKTKRYCFVATVINHNYNVHYDRKHGSDIWASSWVNGTYHIGSLQSLRCSHTWSMEVDEGSNQKSDNLAPLNGCACVFKEWVYGGRKVP